MNTSPGTFGYFAVGDEDLPVYQYKGPSRVEVPPGSSIPDVPFFLLGNHRFLSFIRVDGALSWLSGERCWMRLVKPSKKPTGSVRVEQHSRPISGTASFCSDSDARSFGVGYARFESTLSGLTLTRQLCTPAPISCGDAKPAVILTWRAYNPTEEVKQWAVEEELRIAPRMLGHRYLAENDLPVTYTPLFQTGSHGGQVCFRAEPRDPHHQVDRAAPCPVDLFPPTVSIHFLDEANWDLEWRDGSLFIRMVGSIAPGDTVEESIILGLEFQEGFDLEGLLVASVGQDIPFRDQWRQRIPRYELEASPEFQLELQWHSYVLDALATRHELSGETYIPQGTAYDFGAGTNAAPRDHLQHMLGVLHADSALAKSCLRFVMNKMTPMGEILYTEVDVGRLSNQMWHTSDQALYLFRSVSAYLRYTEDIAFLDEVCGYAPYGSDITGTVKEHLERAFAYLRDEIGLGLVGLPKLLNSDWNDAIFYARPIREHFFSASSVANAGMAVTALGEFIEVMDDLNAWGELSVWRASVIAYRSRVEGALLRGLGDRDFAARAHLGDGTVLGDTVVYLEPQPWLLMNPNLDADQKHRIIKKVEAALGEPKGPFLRQMEIPDVEDTVFEVGEGENAACWYALLGEWILALSGVDPDKARITWESISFQAYREAYPSHWIGQWTAPDTLNSSLSTQAGWVNRNFYELVTMPVFCAHQHAWAVYTWHMIQGSNEGATGPQT